MIHPLDWSLNNIYRKLKTFKGVFPDIITSQDIKYYSKYIDCKGKVVLDVGASNGDSARLFLSMGAKHVYCIELQKKLADSIHLQNTTVINEAFRLEHLELPFDVAKFDIEGYEQKLAAFHASELKPTFMEVHGQQLVDLFIERGWICIKRDDPAGCLAYMVNYPVVVGSNPLWRRPIKHW